MTEGTIYDLKRLGARAIVWGSGLIALGWVVGLVLGRLSDIMGMGVVMAVAGAGLWGIALTFLVKEEEIKPYGQEEEAEESDE
jgi:hypothetical protein